MPPLGVQTCVNGQGQDISRPYNGESGDIEEAEEFAAFFEVGFEIDFGCDA